MKQNSNEHIVMSVAKTANGIELQEDISGTLPEPSSLLAMYIVHFCQHLSKKEVTTDGHKINPQYILTGVIVAAQNIIDDELDMEDLG